MLPTGATSISPSIARASEGVGGVGAPDAVEGPDPDGASPDLPEPGSNPVKSCSGATAPVYKPYPITSTTIRIPIPPVLFRSPPHARTPDTSHPIQETKYATRRGNRRSSKTSASHIDSSHGAPMVIHASTCYPTIYTYSVSQHDWDEGSDAVVRRLGVGRGVYARHRLDLSPRDVFFGVGACFLPMRRGRLESEVLGLCSIEDNGLVCRSVRSGWDLWLGAQDFRVGDEVLVSAVTHPDMVRIIRGHGLRAVPVDIDPRTLAPLPSALEAARTSRTRVVLVAHLFGGRMDLGLVTRFAREHGLILV